MEQVIAHSRSARIGGEGDVSVCSDGVLASVRALIPCDDRWSNKSTADLFVIKLICLLLRLSAMRVPKVSLSLSLSIFIYLLLPLLPVHLRVSIIIHSRLHNYNWYLASILKLTCVSFRRPYIWCSSDLAQYYLALTRRPFVCWWCSQILSVDPLVYVRIPESVAYLIYAQFSRPTSLLFLSVLFLLPTLPFDLPTFALSPCSQLSWSPSFPLIPILSLSLSLLSSSLSPLSLALPLSSFSFLSSFFLLPYFHPLPWATYFQKVSSYKF